VASDNRGDLIQVTGLWANENQNGQYLSGSVGGLRILIFPNRRRDSDKHPTHVLCVTRNQRREQRDRRDDQGERRQQTPNHDDLPF
jgi:hypothetical protein